MYGKLSSDSIDCISVSSCMIPFCLVSLLYLPPCCLFNKYPYIWTHMYPERSLAALCWWHEICNDACQVEVVELKLLNSY
jgi:hypothetical protein